MQFRFFYIFLYLHWNIQIKSKIGDIRAEATRREIRKENKNEKIIIIL